MAGAAGPVRRSTAGTGLRVGEADAVLPATSEIMDETAGETAPNSPPPVRPVEWPAAAGQTAPHPVAIAVAGLLFFLAAIIASITFGRVDEIAWALIVLGVALIGVALVGRA